MVLRYWCVDCHGIFRKSTLMVENHNLVLVGYNSDDENTLKRPHTILDDDGIDEEEEEEEEDWTTITAAEKRARYEEWKSVEICNHKNFTPTLMPPQNTPEYTVLVNMIAVEIASIYARKQEAGMRDGNNKASFTLGAIGIPVGIMMYEGFTYAPTPSLPTQSQPVPFLVIQQIETLEKYWKRGYATVVLAALESICRNRIRLTTSEWFLDKFKRDMNSSTKLDAVTPFARVLNIESVISRGLRQTLTKRGYREKDTNWYKTFPSELQSPPVTALNVASFAEYKISS